MKKILFAAVAATAVIASASTASAQMRAFDYNTQAATPQQTGGGSLGYNWSIQSLDQVG